MGYTIAVAGKGGTGKTTLSALLIKLLKEKKAGSILAIDADPNSNLAEILGIKTTQTIGGMLEEISSNPEIVPKGMPKDNFIEYKVHSLIQENEGFDILTMGRPEGPGCYCYVNNVLKNIMSKLIKDYDYIIIDNEAGLEHLSRKITKQADALLVITDPTVVGLQSAKRINDIVNELKISTKKRFLIINKSEEETAKEKLDFLEPKNIFNLPFDREIRDASINGSSLIKVKDKNILFSSLMTIGEIIWQ